MALHARKKNYKNEQKCHYITVITKNMTTKIVK